MFEGRRRRRRARTDQVPDLPAALRDLIARAGAAGHPGGAESEPGAGLIDRIRALEELKSAAAAAQARATAEFAEVQRAAQRAAGLSAGKVGLGVAAQVALARRDGPWKGSRHLGLAEALVHELPHTMAALEAGLINEWRATLVVRETACLSREHRGQVDAELAARPGAFAALGDRALAAEARRIGYRLDPHAVTRRAAAAEAERRVSLRPAPDTMSLLTGVLPARHGVAAYTALCKYADALRAKGDPRSRNQIMADTLVERVTGEKPNRTPVEIHLVMTDTTLLGGDHEPAELDGYGPLPAPFTRRWLRGERDEQTEEDDPDLAAARVWVRRLFRHPKTNALVAMDSRRRCFEGKLRRFLILRDRACRTPWCDAPIRHLDHPRRHSVSGRTSASDGQGLCEACNYTKEAPGWKAWTRGDGSVESTTPTGHQYLSRPPPPIGRRRTSRRNPVLQR